MIFTTSKGVVTTAETMLPTLPETIRGSSGKVFMKLALLGEKEEETRTADAPLTVTLDIPYALSRR